MNGIIGVGILGGTGGTASNAAAQSHTHANTATLNSLSKDAEGKLLLNNTPVDTTLEVLPIDETPLRVIDKVLTFSIEQLPEL